MAMEMEDLLGDMASDWQLDQALGLTLFDDPWKSLGQTEPVKQSSPTPGVTEHVSRDDRPEDPFSQQWMEDGFAKLFESIAAEPETVEQLMKDEANLFAEILEHEQPTSSPPSTDEETVASPEANVVPVICIGSSSDIPMESDYGLLGSPLSAEDVESLLSSSEPSSPDSTRPPSPAPKPISDLEKLLTSDIPLSQTRAKNSGGRSCRPKVKTVSSSCDINIEFLSKKEKKKIQNKNAAIRYRMKKKAESETIREEEKQLEDKNKTLKDKVDQLQREIQYMKDLMNEVYSAKKRS